jgi:hypothetical protein
MFFKPAELRINDDAMRKARERAEAMDLEAAMIFERLVTESEERMAAASTESTLRQDLARRISDKSFEVAIERRSQEQNGVVPSEAAKRRLAFMDRDLDNMRDKLRSRDKKEPKLTPEESRRQRAIHDLNGFMRDSTIKRSLAEQIGTLPMYRELVTKRRELPANSDPVKLNEKTEAKLESMVKEYIFLQTAKPTLDDVLAKIRADHARLVAEGAPDIREVLQYKRRFGNRGPRSLGDTFWPRASLFNRDLTASMYVDRANAWLARLFPEQTLKDAEDLARAALANEQTTGNAEREQREAELRAEWLETCRLYVRLCAELEKPIPEVHPLAMFEIEVGDALERPQSTVLSFDAPAGSGPTLGAPIDLSVLKGGN